MADLCPDHPTDLGLAAEDGWAGVTCKCCDEPFDTGTWTLTGHGGDEWGGSAAYECPTDDCPGTASVTY